MRGRAIPISWPCKSSEGRGTHIQTQSCAGLTLPLITKLSTHAIQSSHAAAMWTVKNG